MTGMRDGTSNSRVVLVTGASTGIGLALVKALQQSGEFRVVATSRSSSLPRFSEAHVQESEQLRIRPLDITNPGEREAVLDEIERDWGGVDVLVNNAGISYRAVQEHLTEVDEELQFNVNYFAPMRLTRAVLPYMRRQRSGHIINVSSVGGMMAMPTMSVYSASKFALEGASEGLWYELRPWNIRVSLVQPGFMNSSGFEHVKIPPRAEHEQELDGTAYHAHYTFMADFIGRHMRRARATPESVAKKILKTMRQPEPPLRVPATIDARLFSILRRILPRRIYHRLLYYCLPHIRQWGDGQSVVKQTKSIPQTHLLRDLQETD